MIDRKREIEWLEETLAEIRRKNDDERLLRYWERVMAGEDDE